MKRLIFTFALSLTVAANSFALPLQKDLVPEDAKWLIHFDLDNFRESKLGQMVINEMLAEPLARLKTEMKVDGQLILQKLHSVTAFGNDFETGSKADGVLLLSGEEETCKIAEGFLAAQNLQDSEGPIQKLQHDGFALYSVNKEIYVSPRLAGHVVVSKSRKQIEAVSKVLSGKGRGTGNEAFSGYAKIPNSFFFLAVAEGFNENAALPAQAKILKMAEGGRIVLGENAGLLFLNLALKAKDSDVIQQIKQVLEGMTALVALGQSENKELMELIQATKVSSTDKMVMVNIEYPLSKVQFDKFSKQIHKSLGKSKSGKRAKSQSPKPEEAEAPDQKQ